MLLKELIKFSSQHRTLYCYLILSIWIFLLIAGKFLFLNQLINRRKTKNNFPNFQVCVNIYLYRKTHHH